MGNYNATASTTQSPWAGLILNGGASISGGTLATQAAGAELVVYSGGSGANAISANITTSTAGVTFFGPTVLNLSGVNTYTGATTINGNMNIAGGSFATGSGTWTVNPGGTLTTAVVLPATVPLTVNGTATLGVAQTLVSLQGSNPAASLTETGLITITGATGTYAGVFSGAAAWPSLPPARRPSATSTTPSAAASPSTPARRCNRADGNLVHSSSNNITIAGGTLSATNSFTLTPSRGIILGTTTAGSNGTILVGAASRSATTA